MRSVRIILVVVIASVLLCLPALAQTGTTPSAQPVDVKPAAPAAPPAPTSGPFQIKIGDASIRFGLLLQPQLDLSENAAGTQQNFLLRRARVLIGGQVSKTVFFFWESDNARMGNANAAGTKTMTTGFQTLDAVVEWRKSKPFNLSAGLIRVPTSRDALESSSNEFTIDFNSYAFTASGALQSTAGRDTGVQARGYFLKDKLEYRVGAFSGVREAGSRNSFRRVGRVQYNFFDTEVYGFPSYAGSNFGNKKILAVGAAIDQQLDYTGVTADVFADIKTGFGSAIGTATYQNLDGGDRGVLRTALPESDIFTVDGGLYFKGSKLGPWARYEQREFARAGTQESRILAGLNYYPFGNNFNVKAAVARFSPAVGEDLNQLVIQLQLSYY